jgi:hypothetical protein
MVGTRAIVGRRVKLPVVVDTFIGRQCRSPLFGGAEEAPFQRLERSTPGFGVAVPEFQVNFVPTDRMPNKGRIPVLSADGRNRVLMATRRKEWDFLTTPRSSFLPDLHESATKSGGIP